MAERRRRLFTKLYVGEEFRGLPTLYDQDSVQIDGVQKITFLATGFSPPEITLTFRGIELYYEPFEAHAKEIIPPASSPTEPIDPSPPKEPVDG
jgi:hypothetical protein